MNMIVGFETDVESTERDVKSTVDMMEQVLQRSFPLILLEHCVAHLDSLIESVLEFQQLGQVTSNRYYHYSVLHKCV